MLKSIVASIAATALLTGAGVSVAANISGAGATFPAPVYAKWAEAYKAQTNNALNYQAIGSGGGIKQINASTVDFGASDKPLKPEALAAGGLQQFPTVVGGVVLAVPALRLRGPYFGLVTLVAVLLLQNLIVLFSGITGGEIGLDIPDVLSLDERVNYWYALGFLVISAIIMFGLSRSALGLILQATGQDRI